MAFIFQNTIKAELEKISKTLTFKELKINEKDEEISELKNIITSIQNDLTSKESEIISLNSVLEMERLFKKELVDRLNNEVADGLILRTDYIIKKLDILENKREKFENIKKKKINEFKDNISKLLELKEQFYECNEHLNQKKDIIVTLNTKIAGLEDFIENYKQDTIQNEERHLLIIKEKDEEIDSLALVKENLTSYISNLTSKFSDQLTTLKNEHVDEIDLMNCKQKELSIVIEQQINEISNYRDNIEKNKSDFTILEQEHLKKMDSLQVEICKLNKEIESNKSLIELELDQNTSNKSQIDQLHKENMRINEDLLIQKEHYEIEISSMKKIKADYKEELQRLETDFMQKIKGNENEIMDYKSEIENAKINFSYLELQSQQKIELMQKEHEKEIMKMNKKHEEFSFEFEEQIKNVMNFKCELEKSKIDFSNMELQYQEKINSLQKLIEEMDLKQVEEIKKLENHYLLNIKEKESTIDQIMSENTKYKDDIHFKNDQYVLEISNMKKLIEEMDLKQVEEIKKLEINYLLNIKEKENKILYLEEEQRKILNDSNQLHQEKINFLLDEIGDLNKRIDFNVSIYKEEWEKNQAQNKSTVDQLIGENLAVKQELIFHTEKHQLEISNMQKISEQIKINHEEEILRLENEFLQHIKEKDDCINELQKQFDELKLKQIQELSSDDSLIELINNDAESNKKILSLTKDNLVINKSTDHSQSTLKDSSISARTHIVYFNKAHSAENIDKVPMKPTIGVKIKNIKMDLKKDSDKDYNKSRVKPNMRKQIVFENGEPRYKDQEVIKQPQVKTLLDLFDE